MAKRGTRKAATNLVYRIAGLPIAVRALKHPPLHSPGKLVRSAYRARFWTARSLGESLGLMFAVLLAPLVLLGMMTWFTARNGATIKANQRRSIFAQLGDQLWLYVKAGVLPPWYYVYELHRRPVKREARSFIQRCECKSGVPGLLKKLNPPASDLADKALFARRCAAHGIATVPVLAVVRDGRLEGLRSPRDLEQDLFVKPVGGKGGRGAKRWDYLGSGRYRSPDGRELDQVEMLVAVAAKSLNAPRLIQPRVRNHPQLEPLNNGALATVRALTCLDESGRPELLGAVLRMAVGSNRVVDNLHAGGIAAAVDLETGELGLASNLGMDCSLGWLERHPNSGAQIAGFRLPHWSEFRAFTERAHGAFSDRIMVGWDVAITPAGLVLVEGNGVPDLDIMQRAYRRGWMTERLGQLLAHHVVRSGCVELAEAA